MVNFTVGWHIHCAHSWNMNFKISTYISSELTILFLNCADPEVSSTLLSCVYEATGS